MYKLLLFVIVSIKLLSSSILEIKDLTKPLNATPYIFYIQDKNNSFTAKDLLSLKNLKKAHRSQLGVSKGAFWTKVQIKNSTENIENLAIYNSLAGINEIDVFVYREGKLFTTHTLGDLRTQEKREVLSRYSMFRLNLEPKKSVTIIAKIKNYHLHNIGWIVEREKSFLKRESTQLFYFGALIGVALLFSFYNILSYRTNKEKAYLIIVLNTLTSVIYIYSFQGVLYRLDLGINLELITASAWNISNISAMALILFPYYFFNISKKYPRLALYLKLKLFTFLTLTTVTLYAQFFNEEYFSSLAIFLLVSFNALSLLAIAIYMYFKKEIGSKYYLFGQGFLLLSIVIHVLVLMNLIPHSDNTKNLFPIGVCLDIIFLTIAQHLKTKKSIKELQEKKEILLEHSRFSSIGQAIGNITHQWKHPMTRLGMTITLLETVRNHKREELERRFDEQLPLMKENLKFMRKTIDEFSQYYGTNIKNEEFDLQNSFDNVLQILSHKLTVKKVSTSFKKEIDTIYGYEHIFTNLLLILINNSLDEFTVEKRNEIAIEIKEIGRRLHIIYEDNGGGIKIEPIERVFEYFVTTKDKGFNQGMGLPILKMLVEDRLMGEVGISNTKEGARFVITAPLNSQ